MATKEKTIASSSAKASGGRSGRGPLVPPELFQVGVYKRNQGRTVRLVTAVTIGVIIALSSWRLYETLAVGTRLQLILPAVLLFAGWWLCYRLVHIPKFADFLIAVEAEMTKVSWPTKTELIRSSVVVIMFIMSLAAILFIFDLFWRKTFELLGIIF